MRALTEAEGRVIAVLLGSTATNERDRLQRLRVPRSTYHAARRRAYAEGWLRDRYVPNPARFGFPIVTVAVVRPFADRTGSLVDRWSRNPANVAAWLGPQAALGVFFHPDASAAERFSASTAEGELGTPVTVIPATSTSPELPVYFDYEGLWAHLAGLEGTATYPNGLGGPIGKEGPTASQLRHRQWSTSELVQRPFRAEAEGRGGHLVGPFGLPFSQLRALRDGWVTHRVFLDPSRVPPYHGRSADQVVLISGSLRKGARPEQLFASLTRECRVFPFLFATHDGRALLGALGRGAANGRAPTEPSEADRRPVLPTIQEYLEGIQVLQEPAAMFRTVVDHRYDRVIPGRTP